MSKKNPHFLPASDISAILEAGGTPWSLISKETGKVLGTVRTRTLAREIAPDLNAKVDKYAAPVEEEKPLTKKEQKDLVKAVKQIQGDAKKEEAPPQAPAAQESQGQQTLPEVPEAPKEGFNDFNPGVNYLLRPQDCHKCPLCGSEEIYSGRVNPKDNSTVIDEGLVGGCHHCDWEYNLIDVNRAKSVIENPTRVAWDIADAMLLEPRKEVVKAMIAAGIANGTSRTQYQYWFNVNKDRKRAAIAEHNEYVKAMGEKDAKKSK